MNLTESPCFLKIFAPLCSQTYSKCTPHTSEKCFGCGMCRTICDEKAIYPIPRSEIKIRKLW